MLKHYLLTGTLAFAICAHANNVEFVDNIDALLDVPTGSTSHVVTVLGYYTGGPGGGDFYWDATCLKSAHNGATVISPTVPWNGLPDTQIAFLDGTGETDPSGSGCWRRPSGTTAFPVTQWGGRGDWNGMSGTDIQPILVRIRDKGISTAGGTIVFDPGYANDYWSHDTINVQRDNVEVVIPRNVTLRSTEETSRGVLLNLGRIWLDVSPEPAAVENVGLSGGGTIICESPGANENCVSLNKVYGGWVRGMNFPSSNKNAITTQYDYKNIWVESNNIGTTGEDAITIQGLFEAAKGDPAKPAENVYVVGNVIQSAGRYGFLAQRNFTTTMRNIVVRENTVYSTVSRGIAFNGVSDPVHSGNIVYSAGGSGAWFSNCTNIRGDVDVRASTDFGLFMQNVTGYDFTFVFVSNTGDDAVRDDEQNGGGHIGQLIVTGTTHPYSYRSTNPTSTTAAVVIDRYNAESGSGTEGHFLTASTRLWPVVQNFSQDIALQTGTAAPSISRNDIGTATYLLNNTSAQNITNFDTTSPATGRTILVRGDGFSVLKHAAGGSLRLKGGVDTTPSPSQYVTFHRRNGLWYEVSRSY